MASPGAPRPGTSVVRMSFISSVLSFPRSARGRGVRQQGNLTGVLHGRGDVPLMLGAVAGHPASADLAAVGDEAAEQGDVLVIDGLRIFLAEGADLLLRFTNRWLGHGMSPEFCGCQPCPCRPVKAWWDGRARLRGSVGSAVGICGWDLRLGSAVGI